MKSQMVNIVLALVLAGGGVFIISKIFLRSPGVPQCPAPVPVELSTGVQSYIDSKIIGARSKENPDELESLSNKVSELDGQLAGLKTMANLTDAKKLVDDLKAIIASRAAQKKGLRAKSRNAELLKIKDKLLESCQPSAAPEASSESASP